VFQQNDPRFHKRPKIPGDRHMRLPFAALLLAFSLPASADQLTIERLHSDPNLSGPGVRQLQMAPDGSRVSFLRGRADDQFQLDLWEFNLQDKSLRRLVDSKALAPAETLSDAEKARRERERTASFHGIAHYDWSPDGKRLLVSVSGNLYLVEASHPEAARKIASGDVIDPQISPKGHYVSFVRSQNLFVFDLASGVEKQLTSDGGGTIHNAEAEFVAQEEMGQTSGYWWAPDETKIALTFVDQSGVDVVDRVDVGAAGATVVHQRYPRVGRPNAKVELYVADVASGRRVKVALGGGDDYLARVDWAKDGRTLYVQRLTRDQRRLEILAVDPASGAAHVILTETSPHWVSLTDDFKPLTDGSFLWSSERDGHRHLYLYSGDGKLIRQVTHGDWPVAQLEGVDEARQVAIFTAHKDTPIEQRLWEVSYAQSGEPKALTPAGGWWTVKVAKSGGAFAGAYQDPKTPPRTGLFRPDGALVRWIEENPLKPGHPFWPYVDHLRTPEFGTIKAADGEDLWWSMRTPAGFDPKKKYPVIVQVYGGPGSALVEKVWHPPADQLLLDAGYILFRLDNRGTPNRSARFETAIDRHMGRVDVEDQLAGAAYLKSLPYVDAAHIGVTGFSYGGYMTLMLLTVPNSPFAAGVAGAPVSDWTLYDTAYTERYMGTPKDNPEGYRLSRVNDRLGNLRPGALMILHGMADDNVVFENSTRVIYDLQGRGIPFEMMAYPGLRHRTGWTSKPMTHRTEITLDFFNRKLKPPGSQ